MKLTQYSSWYLNSIVRTFFDPKIISLMEAYYQIHRYQILLHFYKILDSGIAISLLFVLFV